MTHTYRATGRRVEHDPASRAYAAAPAPIRPVSWRHRLGPVLDQGWLNGCTGWTAADWLNWSGALASRRSFNLAYERPGARTRYLGDQEGRFLYGEATRYDAWPGAFPPADGGSSGLGAAKAMHKLGIIGSYSWTFDFAGALAQAARQPVMVGTVWTPGMSDPDAKGLIRFDPAQVDEDAAGHEYLWHGVNWPRKLARIRNHWSQAWGDGGEAWIPLADLEALIIDHQGDVVVPAVLA